MCPSPDSTSYSRPANIFGNTPVASLTKETPQGVDADILILGRGDLRDVLFTVYHERGLPSRKLDITWCHESEFITGTVNLTPPPYSKTHPLMPLSMERDITHTSP